jgi:hypothetical protein
MMGDLSLRPPKVVDKKAFFDFCYFMLQAVFAVELADDIPVHISLKRNHE